MNNRREIAITTIHDRMVMAYMENQKLYDVLVGEPEEETLSVGDIYLGKVQNIVQNINAAFVEVKKNLICYLPLVEYQKGKCKCGDEILVQVKKAAVKSKQPVVTIYPEIAGRFCVVSMASKEKSVSKKISDNDTREAFRSMMQEKFAEETLGIVIRTNATQVSMQEVEEEIERLLKEMHEIEENSRYRTCFSLLRKETPFYVNYIRGIDMQNVERIITDESEVYDMLALEYPEKAVRYEDATYSLDALLGISSKLEKCMEKRVWLKSGGNIVIEPTEALTVIDVNTGKAIEGKRNQETTFYKINCEAALEAARQIRVRNLSGIILIDFIDMKSKENRNNLMKLLKEEFAKDKTKTVLVDITKLGLVEITRMKKNKSLKESLLLQKNP